MYWLRPIAYFFFSLRSTGGHDPLIYASDRLLCVANVVPWNRGGGGASSMDSPMFILIAIKVCDIFFFFFFFFGGGGLGSCAPPPYATQYVTLEMYHSYRTCFWMAFLTVVHRIFRYLFCNNVWCDILDICKQFCNTFSPPYRYWVYHFRQLSLPHHIRIDNFDFIWVHVLHIPQGYLGLSSLLLLRGYTRNNLTSSGKVCLSLMGFLTFCFQLKYIWQHNKTRPKLGMEKQI